MSHELSIWGKLDRSSDHRGFALGGSDAFRAAVVAFGPTVIYAVDWHGMMLASKLVHVMGHLHAPIKVVYLNFRVFHQVV